MGVSLQFTVFSHQEPLVFLLSGAQGKK